MLHAIFLGLAAHLTALPAIALALAFPLGIVARRSWTNVFLSRALDAAYITSVFIALQATGKLPWYLPMKGFAFFSAAACLTLLSSVFLSLKPTRLFATLHMTAMLFFTIGAIIFTLNDTTLAIEHPTVHIARLPAPFDGLTAAVLADTHIGRPDQGPEWFSHVVRATNDLQADLILILGDVISRPMEEVQYVSLLSGLHAPLGVWTVLGNHENGMPNRFAPPLPAPTVEEWRRIYADAGVHLLENEAVPLRRDGAVLWLVGVGDAYSYHDHLDRAIKGIGPHDACLVLTHSPDLLDDPLIGRVDLMLAGHTHGGGVWLPFVGPLWSPSRLGRARAAGLIREGTTQAYISRGTGRAVMGLRLGNAPEVTLLTLRRSSP